MFTVDPYAGSATDVLLSLQAVQSMSFLLEGSVDGSRLVMYMYLPTFQNTIRAQCHKACKHNKNVLSTDKSCLAETGYQPNYLLFEAPLLTLKMFLTSMRTELSLFVSQQHCFSAISFRGLYTILVKRGNEMTGCPCKRG